VKKWRSNFVAFIIIINNAQDIVLGYYEDSKNANKSCDPFARSYLFWNKISNIANLRFYR
jgi:hypothetical protein